MWTGINYRTDDEADNVSTFSRNFTDFKAGGVGRVSVVLYWGKYESTDGIYVASEYAKLKHILQAAASAGLKVHLDFHTIFPSSGSSAAWATPKNLAENAKLILTGAGKAQFLRFITYTMQQLTGLTIDEVAVLNEPSRYSMTATEKANTIQLWKDARAAVKAVRDVPVGVRFDLAGLKQFTVADTVDTLDRCFVNEYLDHRNPNYTIWGSGWADLQNYVNNAHAKGKLVEVTEWNGYATTPTITQDYMSGHLAKLSSIGIDACYFWGWKGTTSWVWDLAKSDNITPKVPLSVFNVGGITPTPPPPPPAGDCSEYVAQIAVLQSQVNTLANANQGLQSTVDSLNAKIVKAKADLA